MRPQQIFLVMAILAMIGCDKRTNQEDAESPEAIQEMIQRAIAGKQLWEERCKTVAGERIYKTVEGIEGVVLFGIRRDLIHQDFANPMLPAAAFVRESRGEEYIKSFLGYEHSTIPGRPVSPDSRGFVTLEYVVNNESNLPGYQYVDVTETSIDNRLRFTKARVLIGQMDLDSPAVQQAIARDPNFEIDIYEWTLKARPAPEKPPRYGVTIEDHVVPEERELGVASSTVRVIDIETQEILGELTRYVLAAPKSSLNQFPWLRAKSCPPTSGTSYGMTRKFVDQVLIPLAADATGDNR